MFDTCLTKMTQVFSFDRNYRDLFRCKCENKSRFISRKKTRIYLENISQSKPKINSIISRIMLKKFIFRNSAAKPEIIIVSILKTGIEKALSQLHLRKA